ncbi:hypothetical protein ACFLVV_03305 [Chloroflexota bacterium]
MLFYLNNKERTEINPVIQKTFYSIGWKEIDLENLMAKNLERLIPQNQLMVLFQERSFQPEADIYALDKKGDLYIFELKRWESQKENILQVLRYGQKYGQYSYEQLQELLQKYENSGTLDLSQKHYEYFSETISTKLPETEFNKQQHFVVITNGVDLETRNAIKYWQDKWLLIDSIVYWLYVIGEQIIFEFDPYNPEREVIIEEVGKNYIVNTNLTWSSVNYREMLDNGRAAAYGERRYGIERLKRGDTVFLYHNGVGVVAYGKVKNDKYKKRYDEGQKEEEYYVDLSFDWAIDPDKEQDKAVKAWQINKKLSTQHAFRQTIFAIRSQMANAIMELAQSTKTKL